MKFRINGFYARLFGSAIVALGLMATAISAQTEYLKISSGDRNGARSPITVPLSQKYYNPQDGISLAEIIRRTFENNGDLKIARLEVEKARARLTQARLRSNPTIEVEQTTGRIVGTKGEGELSVGLSVPLDIYGQRRRRIDLAQAEITLKEAEITARQRDLASRVFSSYSDALSALKELSTFDDILELDTEMVRIVQIRVNEGEVPPLELNLLQTEAERIRSLRVLTEGKLQTAILKLRFYAGLAETEPLQLREGIAEATFPKLPPTIETSITVALQTRPEIRLADLEEELASAGLRLIRSQSKADVTAYTRYTQGRAGFDDPHGQFFQRDRSLTFGVAIGLPVFNRNQGAKAEAEISIRQARERRVFAEAIIKNEVTTAFQRIEAAKRAILILDTSVLPRSRANVETIRQVYQIGQMKVTDLIAEQRKLVETTRDHTNAMSERYRAEADLFIALGITLEN
jgi:cobalt-zinc-cadmium efflux system outer membrane protein